MSSLKAMFEQNIQKNAAPAKTVPGKLQPSGVFGEQATATTQPKPIVVPKKID